MPRVKLFDEKEVLNKAMVLFWKHGYYATSISHLVKHLGINRGSLYDTYGGKEQLFKKALQEYRRSNIEGVQDFFKRQTDVKIGFQTLFDMAIENSITDQDKKGCFVVNATTELIPGDPEILAVLEENKRTFETLFLQFLQRGESEGQFSTGKDLKSIASLLFTLYNGMKVISKINSNKTELSKTVAIALSILD